MTNLQNHQILIHSLNPHLEKPSIYQRGFCPDAINDLSFPEYGLYMCLSVCGSKTLSELYRLSSDTKEETDKLVENLVQKGWAQKEVINE